MSPIISNQISNIEDNDDDNEPVFNDEEEERMMTESKQRLEELRTRNLSISPLSTGSMFSEDREMNENILDKELLIDIVRRYPLLWMIRHPQYKDKKNALPGITYTSITLTRNSVVGVN